MKRKPLLFAIALLLVVGAALWGVNYRLDHPPLTKADEEFRTLVAGADNVQVFQYNDIIPPPRSTFWNPPEHFEKPLNFNQTRELIDKIRLTSNEAEHNFCLDTSSNTFVFDFQRQNKELLSLTVWLPDKSHPKGIALIRLPSSDSSAFTLNPRFNKRLNRALDAYLPQRIRP